MSKVLKIGGIGTLIGGLIVAAVAGASLVMAQANPTVDTAVSGAMDFESTSAGFAAPLLHPGGPGNGEGDGEGPLADYRDQIKAGIAAYLGMTVEELDQARQDGVRLQELLDERGITRDEFEAAVQDILAGVVAQAVDDGAINQEEADRILEHGLHPGHGPDGPGGQGPGGDGPGLLADYQDQIKAGMADVLGLTVEELEQAREDGIRPEALLEQQGLTVEEFQAGMQPVWESVLNQALDEGAITQEQYDNLLERGFRGPRRGHHHGRPGQNGEFGPNGGPPEGAPGDNDGA